MGSDPTTADLAYDTAACSAWTPRRRLSSPSRGTAVTSIRASPRCCWRPMRPVPPRRPDARLKGAPHAQEPRLGPRRARRARRDPGHRRVGPEGPIKIGFIVSLTGPFAPNGKDMANAFEMYLDEHKYRLAGREVKLITEDDEGKPATGLTKARGLVESQNVHVIVGPISAAIGYAIAPYVDGKKVPTIFPIVSSEDITQRKRSN